MINIKYNNGITLISLVVTVIVLFILASVSIIGGYSLIESSRMESIITNMITIKAKTKMYAEDANSQVWDLNDEDKSLSRKKIFQDNYNLSSNEVLTENDFQSINSDFDFSKYEYYNVNQELIKDVDLKNEEYIIMLDKETYTEIDVLYKNGIEYEGNIYFLLSDIQSVMNI